MLSLARPSNKFGSSHSSFFLSFNICIFPMFIWKPTVRENSPFSSINFSSQLAVGFKIPWVQAASRRASYTREGVTRRAVCQPSAKTVCTGGRRPGLSVTMSVCRGAGRWLLPTLTSEQNHCQMNTKYGRRAGRVCDDRTVPHLVNFQQRLSRLQTALRLLICFKLRMFFFSFNIFCSFSYYGSYEQGRM